MDTFTSRLKAFFKLEGDAESQWAAKGHGRKLGGGAPQGPSSNTGKGMPPMPRSSSTRATSTTINPPHMPRSASTRASLVAADTTPEQSELQARASAPPSSFVRGDLPYPHGPLNVRVEMPRAKSQAGVMPPPQPLASPAERASSASNVSTATEALPNGQPLIARRGRHMHATDVVQQAVLQSVVMANTPTGAECAVLGSHLAMRDMQQQQLLDLDSPPHLRVAAGAMNTPTAAERTLGLAGAWQPELHQDFHFQQCLALIVSQEELMARRCLTTLQRILNNIVDEPSNTKYRALRLSNASIHANIVQVGGALEFLDAAGFVTTFQPASSTSPSSAPPTPPAPAAAPGEQGRDFAQWQEEAVAAAASGSPPDLTVEAVTGTSAAISIEAPAGGARLSQCGSARSSCNSTRYLAAADEEGGSHSPGCAVRVRRGSAGSTSMQRRVSGMITGAIPDVEGMDLPVEGVTRAQTRPASGERPTIPDTHALEGLLVLPDDASLHPLMVALHELGRVMRVMGIDVNAHHGTNSQDGSGHIMQHSNNTSATVMYDAHGSGTAGTAWSPLMDSTPSSLPTRSPSRLAKTGTATPSPSSSQPGASTQPQVDRQTKVVLPVAPDTHEELPEWFFERTAAELKAEVKALAGKRAAGEVLATRAWRERMTARESGSQAAPAQTTTLRVRFPEGVYLQGCFAATEPVTAIFEWVTESLRYPDVSYELVCPGARKPLQPTGTVRQQPELWPAAVLNLRPLHGLVSGTTAKVPLLSDERLATTMVE